jgi:hypothetical protein
MSIFNLRNLIVDEYSKYVQSFILISDKRIREFIENELVNQSALWPEALLQLNPSYRMGATVEQEFKENSCVRPQKAYNNRRLYV